MSQYDEIDAILTGWGEANSLRWYSEYQDTEVRTLFLAPERNDRVQIAVDAPKDGTTVVHLGQLQNGLSRLARKADFSASISGLASTLDEALNIARAWLGEG